MSTILNFSDVKKMLELEKSSFSDYPDLQVIADNVHAALESFCGRSLNEIEKVTETGIFSSSTKFLDLETLPVSSITSVTIEGELFTNYTLDNYGLKLLLAQTGSYSVVVKGGFKEIPEAIYRAELSQTVYEYQQKNNLATTNFSNAGGTTTSPGFVLLKEVKRLISSYVHPKKSGF